jgi:hypothetical protein
MAGQSIPLQVVGLKRHHAVVSVRKSPDVLIRGIHELPQFDGEFLHRLLATEQVRANFQSGELRHGF